MTGRWYLELTDGTGRRHKFYELTLEGQQLVVRWGRIERPGRTLEQHFEFKQDARAQVVRLFAAKLRKGYRLITPGASAPMAVPPSADPRQLNLSLQEQNMQLSPPRNLQRCRLPAQVRARRGAGELRVVYDPPPPGAQVPADPHGPELVLEPAADDGRWL